MELSDAVDGGNVGQIKVNASGGMMPYSFSLDKINFNSTGKFSNLGSGSYFVTEADANDCVMEEIVFIKLQAVVSYSKQIAIILDTNCNISGCHCDGNSLCFSEYNTVYANATGIKDRTSKRAMPPAYSGKVLTEIEIVNIANWVYQGAKNN